MLINLIDARRGLHNKCLELFGDKKIAEQIYQYLCDGIEDCEVVDTIKQCSEDSSHPFAESVMMG